MRRPTAVTLKRKGRAPRCHTRNIYLFPARNIYFLPAAQFMNSMQEFSKTGSQVGKGREGHDQETEVSCGFLKVCPLLLFCWCGNCASWMSIVAWNHKEQERFCHLRRQSALSGTHDEYHLPWKDSITPTEENRKDIKQKEAFWWCHQISTCSRWCLHLHPRTSSAHTSSLRLCGPSSLGVSWALEEILNVVTYWFFSFFSIVNIMLLTYFL